ncbi:MAG: radical SAM protein, partial [Candidatus Aenigmarchaeota archaeon]|nr:radical SAM protein [Candidatus Aenigmarchaeota archaeon]
MLNKVEIVVGFLCNNNCMFCSVGNRNFNKSTEQIKMDIDRAVKENPNEINFTGGEPTIRKDIFELVKYASEKVSDVRITTNGRMLSKKSFTKKIVKSGLTGAIFSIHSPYPKVHDYLVQVNGAFIQAINGLKNLKKFTDKIDVNIVINNLNYRSLHKLTEMLFSKYNVRSICFIYPDIDGNLLENT